MKSVNKILFLFIAFMFLSFGVTWEVLQSKWVGNQVSSLVTKYLETRFNATVSFDNLEFKIYPPGAEIQNLVFDGEKDKTKFNLNAASVGLYFNAFDVFKTNFVVDEILLSDAEVIISAELSEKEKTQTQTQKRQRKKENINQEEILKFINSIPINYISLKNIYVEVNENLKGKINNLQLSNQKDSIGINASFYEIMHDQYKTHLKKLDEMRVSASLKENVIDLSRIEIISDFSKMVLSGEVSNYLNYSQVKYDLKLKGELPLNDLHNWLDFKKIGSLDEGFGEISAKIKGKGKVFKSEVDIKLKEFLTDFLYGQKGKLKVEITNENILVKALSVTNKEQKLKLHKPFEFYNFISTRFVEEPVIVDVVKLQLNNFLRYLRDKLSILDGELSGRIKFDLYEKSFSFKPVGIVNVDRILLKAGDKLNIFDINDLQLRDTEFVVDNGTFLMNVIAERGATNFSLKAKINKDEFNIEMPTSYLELEKFNEIVGLNIAGKGTLNFKIVRDEKTGELIMKSKKDFKGLDVEGYKLDKVKGRINYLLGENTIQIENIDAISSKSKINLLGFFNYKEMSYDAKYNIQKLNFTELKKILSPVMGKLNLSSKEILGQWNSKGRIKGRASLEELNLDGTFKGYNNYFFEENLDQIHAKIKIKNGHLFVTNLIAKKGRGLIRGSYSFDFESFAMDFDLGLYKVGIQDLNYYNRFPLSLRGDLNGNVKGHYNKTLELKTDLNLRNTYVFSEKYEDSFIKLNLSDDKLYTDINFFKGKISLGSNLYFNEPKKESELDLKIQFGDIKKLLGLFSGVDLVNSSARGRLDYSLASRFNLDDLTITNLESNIRRFEFEKPPISAFYKRKNPEIKIVNGNIERWDMSIRGKRFYIYSQGGGNIESDYKTSTQLKIDASIVEVFNNLISKANGNIRGKFEYAQKDGREDYEAYFASSNLSLTSSMFPTGINKSSFKISFSDKKLIIEKLKAQLVSGSFNAKGEIDLGNVIPNIDIRYNLNNAGFTILNKSNLMLSGKGRLIGKNFPYTLSGDIFVQKCSITNELTDFGFGGNSLGEADIPFLPGQEERLLSQFMNFNVNVSTREPIFIRNSLIDVGLVGNVQLLGGEAEPKLSGGINLAARNNKISFKNNEFILTKSNVSFSEDESVKNPLLDFNAKSKIGDYNVNVSLFGNLKDYKLDLSSEPNLNKTDVLSLIAFGYTEDISNNLSDSEKESMTSAGVGSIIFDSFKINETLKNEFGLQVNLGTEISQDQSSYLEGRSADSSVSAGRVRSATTVEVKKKIDDATSMSLTSTVGASSTQKQSINVNYNLNNNVSVEGIYESISTDEAETINDDNSFGADIKWQWTFK